MNPPLYHILMNKVEECDALAGQNIRLSFSGFHTLHRLPVVSSKKRKGGELEETAAKKPRLSEDNVLPIFHQTSAFVRPPGPAQTPGDDHYFVERVLHQRAVHNKVQYLLQLRGENQTIKVWMFDDDLFAGLDANRKNLALYNAQQSGVYPEAHMLPEVEQILGAKMVGAQLMFYVKWANSAIFALVPSPLINKAAPAKVIQFYEQRLSFEPLSGLSDQPASPTQVSSPMSSSESNTAPFFDTLPKFAAPTQPVSS